MSDRPYVSVQMTEVRVETNPGLYEEAGLARVVLGGPASGTVRANPDSYILTANSFGRRAVYSSAVVHFAGLEIRTWMLGGVTPEEHVNSLISWFLAGSDDVLEKVAKEA